MLTKKDISQLKEIFVTKEEFHRFSDEIVKLFGIFRDEIVTEIRTEFSKHIKNADTTLENHERRLDKLEDKVFN